MVKIDVCAIFWGINLWYIYHEFQNNRYFLSVSMFDHMSMRDSDLSMPADGVCQTRLCSRTHVQVASTCSPDSERVLVQICFDVRVRPALLFRDLQSNSNLLSCRLISAPLNFKLKLFPKDCQAQVFEYFSINFSDRSSIAQLFVYFLETVVSFLPSLFIVSSDIFAFCNLYRLILVQELYRWRWPRYWCVSLKR